MIFIVVTALRVSNIFLAIVVMLAYWTAYKQNLQFFHIVQNSVLYKTALLWWCYVYQGQNAYHY